MTSKKSNAAVAAEIRHGSSLKFKRMEFTFEFLFPGSSRRFLRVRLQLHG